MEIIMYVGLGIVLILLIVAVFGSFFTINQGEIGIVTRFGKYKRIALPGLNWKTPFIDALYKRVSIQNHSTELAFQAITNDQANVYFKTMILYSVASQDAENMQLVVFKFADNKDFQMALSKSIEASVRSLVATKKQAEILSLRQEMVIYVKGHLDDTLLKWGYHLQDVQINDITFDAKITDSMADVVASSNLKSAAENQGNALLITKTKAAEAEGNAIRISAQAEKDAAQLRGEGVAAFRKAVSEGIVQSAKELTDNNVDISMIMFSMWTESIKNIAEVGKGNIIFLDGSIEGMTKANTMLTGLASKSITANN